MKIKDLMVFTNEDFGDVRAIINDNRPWFVGKDVAEALGYKDTSDALKKHIDVEDKMSRQIADPLGRLQNTWLINESGIYSLIMLSKLPTAKKFKKWVTSEVLPSIRKHGTYMTDEVLKKVITTPEFVIELATALKTEKEKRIVAEKQMEVQQPKVEMYNNFLKSDEGIDMDEAANILKEPDLGRNNLFDWLRKQNILMSGVRNNIPYSSFAHHFEVIEVTNNGKNYPKCLVKPSGISFIRKRINKEKKRLLEAAK